MSKKDMTFETAIVNLEEIIRSMEGGDLELDALLAKFEKGIGLLRVCEGKLKEAEGKIEVLTTKEMAGESLKEKEVAVIEDAPIPDEAPPELEEGESSLF